MLEILNYEKSERGKTIGYVDIKLSVTKPTTLIFKKIAHMQSGDKRWLALPSFSREEEGKEKQYHKFFSFENESHNHRLFDCVKERLQEFCREKGIALFPSVAEETTPF